MVLYALADTAETPIVEDKRQIALGLQRGSFYLFRSETPGGLKNFAADRRGKNQMVELVYVNQNDSADIQR